MASSASKEVVGLTKWDRKTLHQAPAPPTYPSGLKVLVDLGDVLHDALPVWPVGLHQLLNVLFGTEIGVNEQQFGSCVVKE